MTEHQQLIALHGHLCECTTPTGTKCGGFYTIFRMLGMEHLTSDQMQRLFEKLQSMNLITEYTHISMEAHGVPNRWTCRVINRDFSHQHTTQ